MAIFCRPHAQVTAATRRGSARLAIGVVPPAPSRAGSGTGTQSAAISLAWLASRAAVCTPTCQQAWTQQHRDRDREGCLCSFSAVVHPLIATVGSMLLCLNCCRHCCSA